VKLPPWDYLFLAFNHANFPDLFTATWVSALALLVILAILYNVRTRALHRHPPFLEMWEWIWWAGLITFSLILVESLFVFDLFLVLLTEAIGLATLVWIRFIRVPPMLEAYQARLAKERYFTRQRFSDPEATIKRRGGARRTTPRRSRR
jgi:hypothetical protein